MCHSSPCAQAPLTARRRSVFQHRRAGATGDGVEGKRGEAKWRGQDTAAGSLSSTSQADFINWKRESANIQTCAKWLRNNPHSARSSFVFVFPPFPDRQASMLMWHNGHHLCAGDSGPRSAPHHPADLPVTVNYSISRLISRVSRTCFICFTWRSCVREQTTQICNIILKTNYM